MIEKKSAIIEIIIYVLLLSSAAFMVLLTEHAYSTRILLGLLLVTPALVNVKKKGIAAAKPFRTIPTLSRVHCFYNFHSQ